MQVELAQDVPQVPGLAIDAEVVVIRRTEVVAIITANAVNQQFSSWFKMAVDEVRPLHVKRLGTSGRRHVRRRQARVLVTLSLTGSQAPEDAIMAFLRGTLRKVDARHVAKMAITKPPTPRTARSIQLADSPTYRHTPRRQLAYR